MKLELRRVAFASSGARSARQSWAERRSIFLRLSHDGTTGLGEASPLPGYSADDLDSVEAALGVVAPEAVLAALQHAEPFGALGEIAALAPSGLPSARMALETAALDWLGRRRGVSAPALLGADGGARALAALLPPAPLEAVVAAAESLTREGYRCLKLKLGAPGAWAEELRTAARVRALVGADVALRVDANGALTADQLREAWPSLERLQLELFEEPGAVPLELGSALPLALDESLQGLSLPAVAGRLRGLRPRAVVLKPMALGGLTHCWQVAGLAQSLGVSAIVSHCFDGPLAFAATAALALALGPSRPHGLAPHAALATWPDLQLPVERGVLVPWLTPGLGLPAELWA